jgi:DNA-binding transcriptional ArsR family regulator
MTGKQAQLDAQRLDRDAQARTISDALMAKRRKAAADVTRQRALRILGDGEERTAKQLSDELGVGVNGLYYHLRVLEDAELVAPGAGRASGSGMERTYRKSDKWLVTHELNEDLVHVFNALLETAKHETEQAVYRQIEAAKKREEPAVVGDVQPFVAVNSPSFRTTPAEIREFADRLWELCTEFRDRATHMQALPAVKGAPLSELFCAYAIVEREPVVAPSQ